MNKSPRVALYVRVSTTDQRPELQLDESLTYAERRGWTIQATYQDQGVSGSKDRRPGLDKLLADARARRFNVLLVWKSDRLFRSLKHMVNALSEFTELGIDFCSVTETFDTTTPQGRLLLHLVAAFAEFERSTIAERVRAGMTAARKRGKILGRKRKTLDAQTIIALNRAGFSVREITKKFPGCSRSTVWRCLKKVYSKDHATKPND